MTGLRTFESVLNFANTTGVKKIMHEADAEMAVA
jgi:hypothetical protein